MNSALDLLEDMGILNKMEEDGIVKPVTRGGLISPFGYKCINTDGAQYGTVTGCKTYAIKRRIADEYIVKAASTHASVDLLELTNVTNAVFISPDVIDHVDSEEAVGHWNIAIDSERTTQKQLQARVMLICDGSTSYLAQKLGIIPQGSQPEAVCSHAYVKGSTHKWKEADGVSG